MNDKTENPYVYPQAEKCGEVAIAYGGMTLRDYFAGEALKSYVSLEPTKHGLNAIMSYAQADAMLKARQK